MGLKAGLGGHSVFDPNVGIAPPQFLDLTHSPIALWNFDGNLLDDVSSQAFSNTAGTERYGHGILPGKRALYLDGATSFEETSPNAALRIVGGALTIQALIWRLDTDFNLSQNLGVVAEVGVGPGTAADNMLYSLTLHTKGINAFYESPAQTFINMNLSPTMHTQWGRWHHLAYSQDGASPTLRRRLFLNGFKVNETTETALPVGGSSSRLRIGIFEVATFFKGFLQSVKVIGSELTEAQILAEKERVMPLGFAP